MPEVELYSLSVDTSTEEHNKTKSQYKQKLVFTYVHFIRKY